MLNILIGIGGSGSYMIHRSSQPYEIDFSPTLLTSSIGLLALLVVTLVFVPLNGYVLTRRWGVFLIVSYAIIMLVNIGTELRHRGWEAGVRRFGSG
jgi:solute carrier family 24 (sodium/potassium/calcium exchanger), member 6